MKSRKVVIACLLAGGMLLAVSACEKKEGPMETAGKAVDNAAAKAGEKVEKAGTNIQDAVKGDQK